MIVASLHALLWSIALVALMASAWTDLKLRIIPDTLSGVVAASGLGLSLMVRPDETWISVLAATLTLFGLGVFAHYGAVGGGDVKMISAATLLVPPAHIGQLLACIALAGGLLACTYLLARRALRSGHSGKWRASANLAGGAQGLVAHECARIAAGGPLPYALAILGGVASVTAGELSQCLSASFCSF